MPPSIVLPKTTKAGSPNVKMPTATKSSPVKAGKIAAPKFSNAQGLRSYLAASKSSLFNGKTTGRNYNKR